MNTWVVRGWMDKLGEVENDLSSREFWRFDKLRDKVESGEDIADGDLQFLENLVERYA